VITDRTASLFKGERADGVELAVVFPANRNLSVR